MALSPRILQGLRSRDLQLVGKVFRRGWFRRGWLRIPGIRAGSGHRSLTWAAWRPLLCPAQPQVFCFLGTSGSCLLSLGQCACQGAESFAQAAAAYLLTMTPVGAAPPAPFPTLCGCILFTQRWNNNLLDLIFQLRGFCVCLSLSSKIVVLSFTKIWSVNMERKCSGVECLLSRLIN